MKVNKVGFTLVELLVVVLIIGILTAIGLPQYQKAVEKSRLIEAITRVRDLSLAEHMYYMTHGEFVTDPAKVLTELDLTFGNSLNTSSYVVSVQGQGNDLIVQASRGVGNSGGPYSGALLQSKVEPSGKITKRCVEGATVGLCNLISEPDYITGDSLLISSVDENEEDDGGKEPVSGCIIDFPGDENCAPGDVDMSDIL